MFLEGNDEDVLQNDENQLMALITVNGSSIKEKTRLADGDIIVIGISSVFVVKIEVLHAGALIPMESVKHNIGDILRSSGII